MLCRIVSADWQLIELYSIHFWAHAIPLKRSWFATHSAILSDSAPPAADVRGLPHVATYRGASQVLEAPWRGGGLRRGRGRWRSRLDLSCGRLGQRRSWPSACTPRTLRCGRRAIDRRTRRAAPEGVTGDS